MAANDQVEIEAVCRLESFTKIYSFEIEKYSLIKGLKTEVYIMLGTFHLAGFCWAVLFYPNGWLSACNAYISLELKLLSETSVAMVVTYEFSLLDQKRRCPTGTLKNEGLTYRKQGDESGFAKFMKRTDLETSEYLKNDCLTIQLHLTVIKPLCNAATRKDVIVPSSDIHQHFGELLESGEGADITIKINEETFSAHKCVLASRSPVFKAQLFGPMMESKMDSLKIEDMRTDVFKVILQFIYTGMCATEMMSYEMAQHLLVAADKYGLERLKLICEKKLCDSLAVVTALSTLILAELHNCRQLKDVCIDFLASPDILDAVMVTDGYKYLMSAWPLLLEEIVAKFLISRSF